MKTQQQRGVLGNDVGGPKAQCFGSLPGDRERETLLARHRLQARQLRDRSRFGGCHQHTGGIDSRALGTANRPAAAELVDGAFDGDERRITVDIVHWTVCSKELAKRDW